MNLLMLILEKNKINLFCESFHLIEEKIYNHKLQKVQTKGEAKKNISKSKENLISKYRFAYFLSF